MKYSDPKALRSNRHLRSSLLINVCPLSYKGISIYRRPYIRSNTPNYTFSVPDKWLYTLFKGITVTPCFVRASNVSSHGRASFTRGTFCLCFVRRPLHVRRAYVWRSSSDKAGATTRATPSAPKRSTMHCSHGGPPRRSM
jgi:hypothetical protein